MSNDDLPGLMTRVEAAEYLRVSLPTLHRMIRSGKVLAVKVGANTRILADSMNTFVLGAQPPERKDDHE